MIELKDLDDKTRDFYREEFGNDIHNYSFIIIHVAIPYFNNVNPSDFLDKEDILYNISFVSLDLANRLVGYCKNYWDEIIKINMQIGEINNIFDIFDKNGVIYDINALVYNP